MVLFLKTPTGFVSLNLCHFLSFPLYPSLFCPPVICFCLSLCLFIFFSLFFSVSVSHFSISISVSFFILSLSFSLYYSLFCRGICISVPASFDLSLSPCFALFLSLTLYVFITLCIYVFSFYVSMSLFLTRSLCLCKHASISWRLFMITNCK